MSAPTTEPASVTAGDTIAWTKALADYPASDGWVLTYTLANSAARITVPTTADGDVHAVSVLPATSAAWAPGTYSVQAHVAKAGARYTVGTGTLQVLPNLVAGSLIDTRSAARQALEAADAALRTYGNKAWLQGFAIGNRQQTFRSPDEFFSYRSRLQQEVAREDARQRIEAGLAPRNLVYVRLKKQ